VGAREDRREARPAASRLSRAPGADRLARERRERLLRWYRAHRRDLPWRRTRDPYAIWIAEAMLQQTRVETVIPYYERFLARFPDVASLARAEPDALLGAWAGLGYYSRARNLRRAAEAIATRHGGRLPETAAALEALPGIGRYTAGAVASLAFGAAVPAVDTNAMRVLARVFGLRGRKGTARHERRVWALAEALVPRRRSADWNQALMDLGATICTARVPRCPSCPVRRHCAYGTRAR